MIDLMMTKYPERPYENDSFLAFPVTSPFVKDAKLNAYMQGPRCEKQACD